MKTYFTITYSLSILLLFLACSSEDEYPTLQAEFEVPERVLIGQSFSVREVTFGAAGYIWDFGNGFTSTEQLPQNIMYQEPGVYTVSLTVISVGQAQTTTQREVVVGQYKAFRMELLDLNSNFRDIDMNMYYTISEIRTFPTELAVEEEIFRSDLISGFNSNTLPLNIELDGIPLGGYGYSRERNPVIRFFNAETDDVIAAHGHTIRDTFSWRHEFGGDLQDGNFISTATAGSRIRVYYQAVYPNDKP